MTKLILNLALLLMPMIYLSCAPNYNKKMSKAIKKAIGSDLKGYQTFSYPTDNFGLITSYQYAANDTNFICDMWNCIGIDTPPSNTTSWIGLNGFAAPGTGGTISLSEKIKKDIAVNVILPKVYDVINITAGSSFSQTSNVVVTIGKAYLRKLRKDPMEQYITGLDNSKALKRAFNAGNLVYIIADCVIEDLSVSVSVDQGIANNLDTKIGSGLTSKVFSDLSLSVKVDKNVNGTYTFKVSHPVVYARLAKKQPSAGELGADDDFNDWQPYTLTYDPSILKSGH